MEMINDDREGSPDILSNCEAMFKCAETLAHYKSNGKYRSDLTNKNTNRYYVLDGIALAARDIDIEMRFDTVARYAALIKFMKNDIGLSAKILRLDEFDGLENRESCLMRHL